MKNTCPTEKKSIQSVIIIWDKDHDFNNFPSR